MRKYKTAVQLIEIGFLKTMRVEDEKVKNGFECENKC